VGAISEVLVAISRLILLCQHAEVPYRSLRKSQHKQIKLYTSTSPKPLSFIVLKILYITTLKSFTHSPQTIKIYTMTLLSDTGW